MSTWNKNGYFDTRRRFEGPLDLRAPEEQFVTDDQIDRRYREPVQSPEVEKAINSFMRAWHEGDAVGMRLAAEDVKSRTRAHFQMQGVPIIAHPILPPQFVRQVGEMVRELPLHGRETEFDNLADKFGPNLKKAVAQEFAGDLSPTATRAHVESRDGGQGAQSSLSQIPKAIAALDLRRANPVAADLLSPHGGERVAYNATAVRGPAAWGSTERPIADRAHLGAPREVWRPQEELEGAPAREMADQRARNSTVLKTLEYDPDEEPATMKPVRYIDDQGNIVIEAIELPDGTMPPPRPAYNKVLTIQSTIPSKGSPPGYSSGEFDPGAVGLRKEWDPKTNKEVYKPHHGIDFRAGHGDPARVAADGVVVAIADNVPGYGTLVAVRHPDGTMTMYAHLVQGKVPVRSGEYIRAGTVLGYAGTTGNAGRPQVHFEVWRGAYLVGAGQLDYKRGHQNLIDPYKWYDRPMTIPPPRPKPTTW